MEGADMTFVTMRHRATTASALRLVLETERPPASWELEDLDRFEQTWASHHCKPGKHAVRESRPAVDEIDDALWALGGEEAISAG
jgi:hypothetical protein